MEAYAFSPIEIYKYFPQLRNLSEANLFCYLYIFCIAICKQNFNKRIRIIIYSNHFTFFHPTEKTVAGDMYVYKDRVPLFEPLTSLTGGAFNLLVSVRVMMGGCARSLTNFC